MRVVAPPLHTDVHHRCRQRKPVFQKRLLAEENGLFLPLDVGIASSHLRNDMGGAPGPFLTEARLPHNLPPVSQEKADKHAVRKGWSWKLSVEVRE